jgi:general secretion pathway protein G
MNVTRTKAKTKRAPRGMSLIEIMVVITLIALVTAAVGVSVFKVKRDGDVQIARSQAHELAKSVQMYRLSRGALPSTSQGLVALTEPPPLMEKLPLDPWGNAYAYVAPGTRNTRSFDVVSRGPDGIEGTDDDVGNWDG